VTTGRCEHRGDRDLPRAAPGWSAPTRLYVHGRLKFRVKQIVYVAFSPGQSVMGFAFPKEDERRSSRASRASSTCRPRRTCASTGSSRPCGTGPDRSRELVVDAWANGRPKKLSRAYDQTNPNGPG